MDITFPATIKTASFSLVDSVMALDSSASWWPDNRADNQLLESLYDWSCCMHVLNITVPKTQTETPMVKKQLFCQMSQKIFPKSEPEGITVSVLKTEVCFCITYT